MALGYLGIMPLMPTVLGIAKGTSDFLMRHSFGVAPIFPETVLDVCASPVARKPL
jgi:hypothetical protein